MSESFILYTSYYAIIKELTDEQLGQLVRALFIYARDGEVIDLDPVIKMAFSFIKDDLDRNAGRYKKRCERNRQIAIERERKKREERERQTTNVYERVRTCTNVHVNDNDNDNDNDHDNDNDNDVTNVTDNDYIINPPLKRRKCKTEVSHPEKALPEGNSLEKEKKDTTDYIGIMNYWNEQHGKTSSSMRSLTLMTDKRKKLIRARLRQVNGDASILYKVIDQAMESDFLNGNNSRGWTANFDWIFGNENNFAKVLDGYDDAPAREPNKRQQHPTPTKADEPSIGDLYRQQVRQQQRTQQDRDRDAIVRYLGMIDLLKTNPRNLCRGALMSAYQSGELKRLGIDWKPEQQLTEQ